MAVENLEVSRYRDLISISDDVLELAGGNDWTESVHEFLTAVAEAAGEDEWSELHEAASLYASLLQLATSSCDEELLSNEQADQLSGAIVGGLRALRRTMSDGPDAAEQLKMAADDAKEQWGAYIELLDEPTGAYDFDAVIVADDESTANELPSADDVNRILNALSEVEQPAPDDRFAAEPDIAPANTTDSLSVSLVGIEDAELAEAFLDDAGKCLASMESAVLDFENDPANHESLRRICRELHTLKGASGSVGLSELSDYLHRIEDDVQGCCDGGRSAPDIDVLLKCVDTVRRQIEILAPANTKSGELSAPNFDESAPDAEQSIRIKAAQFDRLMDMLSELVMLRNERDSRLEDLKNCYGELIGCVPRIRAANTASPQPMVRTPSSTEPVSGSLTEVADDVAEVAYSLRDAYEPLIDENASISHIIGRFRQELVELRRVPIGRLFRRLRRSVREAARAEGKNVRLELAGEHAGIDRSLQERLYEPLLHIVRNAVSHGIESATERAASGKNAMGTVRLTARGGANFLAIEVSDDGKGLDYDALRRRGRELGLLQSDRPATRDELAQLIFHPGFSTCSSTSEISGRGVGMDVVATALQRMRSWVEVESTPGAGTTVRLTIPLPSVIEHVMRFRSRGQLFAVPMKFVHSARRCDEDSTLEDETTSVCFDDLFGGRQSESSLSEARLVIGYNDADSGGSQSHRISLIVDEIVGSDEVVMRPMPPLLKHDPLYAGVTLAGSGETVLVFDTLRLIECSQRVSASASASPVRKQHEKAAKLLRRALVVDDSVSARRAMSKLLASHRFEVIEAVDGLAATEQLLGGDFDLVVSDLEMPRLGGLDLLEQIKGNATSVHLPVILASSRDEEEFQSRAKELGALAYLAKPVDEEELSETLATCFRD